MAEAVVSLLVLDRQLWRPCCLRLWWQRPWGITVMLITLWVLLFDAAKNTSHGHDCDTDDTPKPATVSGYQQKCPAVDPARMMVLLQPPTIGWAAAPCIVPLTERIIQPYLTYLWHFLFFFGMLCGWDDEVMHIITWCFWPWGIDLAGSLELAVAAKAKNMPLFVCTKNVMILDE